MADIRDLPKHTLICIIKNIKRELAKGRTLTKMDIIKDNSLGCYNLEYHWDGKK